MMSVTQVPGPYVATDCVVFQLVAGQLYVLLVKRRREPYKGRWALPGGTCPLGKTTFVAMSELLQQKTGVIVDKLHVLEQLYSFDSLDDDPRGQAVTVAYMGLTRNITPLASSTTENPQFFPITDLPNPLAYNHREIIDRALERLQAKLAYTNAIFALLPKLFTFPQLHASYEVILGQDLDKRNFRKKFLSLGLVRETDEYLMEGGAHRPAKLFRFNNHHLQYLDRTFD